MCCLSEYACNFTFVLKLLARLCYFNLLFVWQRKGETGERKGLLGNFKYLWINSYGGLNINFVPSFNGTSLKCLHANDLGSMFTGNQSFHFAIADVLSAGHFNLGHADFFFMIKESMTSFPKVKLSRALAWCSESLDCRSWTGLWSDDSMLLYHCQCHVSFQIRCLNYLF